MNETKNSIFKQTERLHKLISSNECNMLSALDFEGTHQSLQRATPTILTAAATKDCAGIFSTCQLTSVFATKVLAMLLPAATGTKSI